MISIDRSILSQPKDIVNKLRLELRAQYALSNPDKVFRYTAINNDAGLETLEAKVKSKQCDDVFKVKTSRGTRFIHKGAQITFYSTKVKKIGGKLVPAEHLTNIWSDIRWEGIANEGSVKLKKGKKPEKLLKRIIDLATNKSDIVLDYHLGSGTTAAVAHKMNRQYIGIEQLDYGDNDSTVRIQNVINGDTTGVSKVVNWKGGGEYVYCELAKWNETAKEKINECTSLDKLIEFFDTLYEKYFLNYNLKFKEFKKEVILEDNFRNLSLEEQKSMFLSMLDLNQMYVNESEMEDIKYDLSEDDIKLTKKFYNKVD